MVVLDAYEDGEGVLAFDGPVTKIGDTTFKDCEYLMSIELPESKTERNRMCKDSEPNNYAYNSFDYKNINTHGHRSDMEEDICLIV